MKNVIILSLLLLFSFLGNGVFAQNSVGIGTQTPNPNAVLQLVSPTNDQGLLVPRLTTAQRTAPPLLSRLTNAENGLMVFDTDENRFFFWSNGQWQPVGNNQLLAGQGISIINDLITNTGDLDPTNEIQDLQLNGNTLTISNNASATEIDLGVYLDNTDNQTAAQVAVSPVGGILQNNVQDALAGLDTRVSNAGDMQRVIYDSNADGIVDQAVNAQTVNGLTVATAVPAGAVFTDNQTANQVAFIPDGGLSAENVQDAILELNTAIANGPQGDMQTAVYDVDLDGIVDAAASINGFTLEIDVPAGAVFTDNQVAASVPYDNTQFGLAAVNVQDALDELADQFAIAIVEDLDKDPTNEIQDIQLNGNLLSITDNPNATEIDLGIYLDNTDSQTASQVPVTPSGGISQTNVQLALEGLDARLQEAGDMTKVVYDIDEDGIVDEAAFAYNVGTVNGLTVETAVPVGAVFTDDQTASQVPVTPKGGISQTNVQSALEGLDARLTSTGDMTKAIYDTNDDGVVDEASFANTAATVNGFTVESAVPGGAIFTDNQTATQVPVINQNGVSGGNVQLALENLVSQIAGGGGGDMLSSIYDPQNIHDDAFNLGLHTGKINSSQLADGAVINTSIAPDAVTSVSIADGSIVDADINASAAISGTKIVPNFGAQNILTTGTVTATSFTGSGAGLTGVSATGFTGSLSGDVSGTQNATIESSRWSNCH